MKILTDKQIRQADQATIEAEGITSIELMERAADGIARWIAANVDPTRRLLFCCGKGGNGGDGLASARILADLGRDCTVLLAASPNDLTGDAHANLARLPESIRVYDVTVERPDVEPDAVLVDALLGVGFSGEVRAPIRGVIEWMNSLSNLVISIDIPSGMAAEWGSAPAPESASSPANAAPNIVRAATTLTIEFPKLALLMPETGQCAGEVVVIPIHLNRKFIDATSTPYYYITEEWVDSLRRPRTKFSHKGDYGHALLVCGSDDMPGAAILATGGAVRSGCGLVTVYVPDSVRGALIANHPSAMLGTPITPASDPVAAVATTHSLDRFTAIGIGPGLGRDSQTAAALKTLLTRIATLRNMSPRGDSPRPTTILDADALNILAEIPDLQDYIPPGSILTPHPGELRRLTGAWHDDREKLEKAQKLAARTASTVILKGAHTAICTPDGRTIFNSTGNPGMAKAGSGDVLTGLVTGLAARGYDAETASVISVYTHGRAGERAARKRGEEAMNATDLIDFL